MPSWLELAALVPHQGPSKAELKAFEVLVRGLAELHVGLPKWVLWDLATVGRERPTRRGSSFLLDRDGRAWLQWLNGDWRPLFAGRRVDGLGATALLQLASITDSWSPGAGAVAEVDGWSWSGGGRLARAAREREEPVRLLGRSVMAELLEFSERPDPFLGAAGGSSAREQHERIRLIGSFTSSRSDRLQEGATGEFDTRSPGPLPENVGRIDPFEFVLAREVPSYFTQRVAENQVGQRFFKVPRHKNTVPRVQVRIELRDTLESHRFPEKGLPPASRERLLVAALVAGLARRTHPTETSGAPEMELHLAIHTHSPLPAFPNASVGVGPELLRAWSVQGRGPVVQWLSEQLPLFASSTPTRRSQPSAPSAGASQAGQGPFWDRRVCVIVGGGLAALATSPPTGSWDLELQVEAAGAEAWRLRERILGPVRGARSEEEILADVQELTLGTQALAARQPPESLAPIIDL